MTERTCPSCGADHVVSVREFRAVFDWREIVSNRARQICFRLEDHAWRPQASEDRQEMARRWLLDDRHECDNRPAPALICADCARPWGVTEVPA